MILQYVSVVPESGLSKHIPSLCTHIPCLNSRRSLNVPLRRQSKAVHHVVFFIAPHAQLLSCALRPLTRFVVGGFLMRIVPVPASGGYQKNRLNSASARSDGFCLSISCFFAGAFAALSFSQHA